MSGSSLPPGWMTAVPTRLETMARTIRFMVFTQAPSAVKDKANITVRLADIDQKHRYRICDIWGDQDLGIFMDSFSAEIELHGSGLYRLTEVE